jgi:hypothetical protein
MNEICRNPTRVGDIVGKPCKECGHANIVHPGPGTPAITQCLLCEMVALIDTYKERSR